ncbi:lipid-A-disaccharide synthase [Candidatus Bandiella euplotis]|uniref:Lipid-A-disaccharide synthase n=1 Tax=Candidatus Bandiella euplotis TaxID=1664265 RepID=A0ABZ0UNZ0_9RICK|nr:lipid-A-disaccharide synthase [Candidatus Bandiella woodruffii]WPX96976.1 Putative fused Sdh5 superfamily flavinator of succinate dehydrogenase and LpxB superfamily lipid-A-disaccharide synthase protein [Candidatus Bandiella woodruffii]
MTLHELKKKLLYQSTHRGCKELDIILGDFARKHLMGFDSQKTKDYETLLNAPDNDIYRWITGLQAVPKEYKTEVMDQLKTSDKKICKIFISAGEASGDNLAARLINSLIEQNKHTYEFYGIAGPNMQNAAGIKSIFPMEELSVTGYLEILPKLFKILFRLFQTVLFVKKLKPQIIITVDSPGFNFLLAKLVRYLKIQSFIINYVAPSVWAYKPERAIKCAKLFDHMMVIFPFEKKYFDEVGLKCTYVGNPTIRNTNIYTHKQKEETKQRYGVSGKKIISIMPGSRNNELKQHLPTIRAFIQKMNKVHDDMWFFIPTLDNIEEKIRGHLPMANVFISKDEHEKKELINSSDLIICKSGTVVLESVAKLIPTIVFYKMSCITAYFVKKKLKTKYVSICNIMMDEEVIPELLQDGFNLSNLLKKSEVLLFNKAERDKQIASFNSFLQQFHDKDKESSQPRSVIDEYTQSILRIGKELSAEHEERIKVRDEMRERKNDDANF